jgi:hypothetical protein
LLSLRVTDEFLSKVNDGQIQVEEIHDSVVKVLEQTGCSGCKGIYSLS